MISSARRFIIFLVTAGLVVTAPLLSLEKIALMRRVCALCFLGVRITALSLSSEGAKECQFESTSLIESASSQRLSCLLPKSNRLYLL